MEADKILHKVKELIRNNYNPAVENDSDPEDWDRADQFDIGYNCGEADTFRRIGKLIGMDI